MGGARGANAPARALRVPVVPARRSSRSIPLSLPDEDSFENRHGVGTAVTIAVLARDDAVEFLSGPIAFEDLVGLAGESQDRGHRAGRVQAAQRHDDLLRIPRIRDLRNQADLLVRVRPAGPG